MPRSDQFGICSGALFLCFKTGIIVEIYYLFFDLVIFLKATPHKAVRRSLCGVAYIILKGTILLI